MTQGKRLYGQATEFIPYDALVLHRDHRVSLAGPELANARARGKLPWERGTNGFKKGEYVTAFPIEGLGDRDLHAMAAGPIMDPVRINLPAGKLSEAAYQERLDLQFAQANITERGR